MFTEALIKFFEYINTMKPKDIPDYTKCRQFFESYLKSEGKSKTSKLEFTASKKPKAKAAVQINDDSDSDSESTRSPRKKSAKENSEAPKTKRGRKAVAKVHIPDSDNSDSEHTSKSPAKRPKENGEVSKPKRGRKVVKESSESENGENEEPEDSIEEVRVAIQRKNKRKSTEPAMVVKVKKTKMAPKATPPVKKNHANIGTQTSVEKRRRSPRQVSFDSPICEVIGDKKPLKLSKENDSANSSGDIFEDSFVIEEKKVKPRRKLLSDEEVVVKRVVKKKVTVTSKAKSWKDSPAVVNGRSPPK